MKKHFILFTCIQTTAAILFLLFGLAFLKTVFLNEMHTVQNLAGAVLQVSPEAEAAFMVALKSPRTAHTAAGAELLARYGYEEDFLSRIPFYRRPLLAFVSIFFIFFFFSICFGLHYFYFVLKTRKAQEELLAALLERCLSDDYGFLENPQESAFPGLGDLSDTFRKLAQKMRLKSEIEEEKDHTKALVTDISHQLKTPLAALKTCFSIYLEADNVQEKKEFEKRCRFQLEKLENLIASLIHISRLESAMILLRPEPSSLQNILVEAVNATYEKAAAKQIAIEAEDFPDLVLSLDKKWTREALFNILDNAVKYSPPGTSIQIRAQKLYSFVRVEIEDQGIGIPKAEYNHIFKRFYRGQNKTVQNSEGSGVGLYLSRKILEQQGGTVSVRAAKKQGSVFVVQLPLEAAKNS